ncbi:MAG TPA: hypothetical protein VK444_02795 [Methanobacteriaceae archaeon]|nr:hypothetical protein [Methanobacteriaceae archaeon]
MNTKIVLGLLVVIVLIGGVSAFSVFQSTDKNTQQSIQTPAQSTQPAVQDSKNTQNSVNAQDQICAKCNGKGYLKCSKCSGTGVINLKCSTCGGDGKVYFDADNNQHPNVIQLLQVLACHEATCPTCGGTGGSGGTACPACGGDGKITCPACGGDGQV